MKELYGSLMIFFYFIKYPIVIYFAINYFYLQLESNFIMDSLVLISIALIVKDWLELYIRSRKTQ